MSETIYPVTTGKPLRAERVAIIEAGKRELWRVYYDNGKSRLEVRIVDQVRDIMLRRADNDRKRDKRSYEAYEGNHRRHRGDIISNEIGGSGS